jgi:hypothetical protein
MKEVQVGDPFQLKILIIDSETNVGKNISTATDMQVYALSPSGLVLTMTGSFVTDGSDYLLYCTFAEGATDVSGLWKAQSKMTMPSGTLKSKVVHFQVMDNLT